MNVSPIRRKVRLLSGVIACACVACGPATYEPRAPRWQKTATGVVRPKKIVAGLLPDYNEISLETRLAPGTRLGVAGAHADRIAEYAETDCASTVAPLQLIDDRPRWTATGPEIGGQHELTLRPVRIDAYSMRPIAIETEHTGRTYCDVVAVDWPNGWRRVGPWHVSALLGADLELTREDGVGGSRLMIARFSERRRLALELGLWNASICNDAPCDLAFPVAFDIDWASTGLYNLGEQDSGVTVGLGLRASAASIHDRSSLALRRGYGSAQLVAWGLLGHMPHPDIDPAPAGATFEVRLGAGPTLALDDEGAAPGLALSLNFGLGWAR